MKEKLELLKEMLNPDYDHEESDTSVEEIFSDCYKWHDYRKGDRPQGTRSCGSSKFDDTPKALYRILYLTGVDTVDFSDMFKSGTLIEICSPDYDFRAGVEFYKFELAVRFGCVKEHCLGTRNMIECGVPGHDNGVKCSSEIGNLWFGMFMKCLNYKYCVYGGNDFFV